MKALIDFDWPVVVIPARKWLLKYGNAQSERELYKLTMCRLECSPKEHTISLHPSSKSSTDSRL
jgi:hypothetical protein